MRPLRQQSCALLVETRTLLQRNALSLEELLLGRDAFKGDTGLCQLVARRCLLLNETLQRVTVAAQLGELGICPLQIASVSRRSSALPSEPPRVSAPAPRLLFARPRQLRPRSVDSSVSGDWPASATAPS